MRNPREPANQLFYGSEYAQSYADRNLAHLVSSNPETVTRMRRNYGRYLSGLGSNEVPVTSAGYDPRYQDRHLFDLEKEDDTFGSGIFDPEARPGTSNPTMGVFASHDSLPGYIARDVPFTVSQDVTDITDDAAVVSIPAGGLFYVGEGQRPTRPAQIEPAGWTTHDQTYVKMTPGEPASRRTLMRRALRVAGARRDLRQVPFSPAERLVPESPTSRSVAYRPIVNPRMIKAPMHRVPHPVSRAAPDMPSDPGVPFRQTVNVAVTPVAVSGWGATDPSAETESKNDRGELSNSQKVLAGLATGAVIGIFVHVLAGPKKGR